MLHNTDKSATFHHSKYLYTSIWIELADVTLKRIATVGYIMIDPIGARDGDEKH